MNLVAVVKRGEYSNSTISSIRFDRWGSQTNQAIIECDTWQQGFESAKNAGYSWALFADSGTVFFDWHTWLQELIAYPNRGLVAHIIWHPDQQPSLHEQCWLMKLDQFDSSCFTADTVSYADPVRSTDNIHSNYTPLHIRTGAGPRQQHPVTAFGQGIIAQQLNRGQAVVNWHQRIRQHKMYMYSEEPVQKARWHEAMFNYSNLAEQQFWVLNNEPVKLLNQQHLLMPGAGVFWLANVVQPTTHSIQIVDISQRQIEFCRQLWTKWDGHNYGEFAWQYVRDNHLIHVEFDQADMDPIQRLKLKNPGRFVEYVNANFKSTMAQLGIDNFAHMWAQRNRVTFSADAGDIVSWIVEQRTSNVDGVWLSNILDYKWTMLNNSSAQLRLCLDRLENIKIV